MLGVAGSNLNIFKLEPRTRRNMSQQGGQPHATCCDCWARLKINFVFKADLVGFFLVGVVGDG